jgi:hypothetical protein
MKKAKKHTDNVPSAELQFSSMAAAARQTGVPYSVLRRAKRAGAPGYHASGRLDLRPVMDWWFAQDGVAPSAMGIDDALKAVRTERERFRLERDKGEYYLASEFEEEVTRTMAKMQRELERRLLAVVPGEGAHLSPRDLQKVMKDHLGKWADYCQSEADKLRRQVK